MRPELRAVARRRLGVFTRRDALACGYTEREVRTATSRRGEWVVVRRGCYVERQLFDRVGKNGRYLLQVSAAALSADPGVIVSHGSAACALLMPLRPRWRELVHLTQVGVTGTRTEHGIKHHRAGCDQADLTMSGTLRTTGLARTAIDIAREHGYEDGVVACDAAKRLGAADVDLERVLDQMRCWPRITTARAAVRVADGGAQNPAESLLRLMVLELDIGVPETQFVVRDDSRWAAADVRVGRHLFEFDGRVKYVGRESGGVADRPVQDILWDEKQREDWLRRVHGGFGVSRVTWQEMLGAQRRSTLRRLYDEYQQTVARLGR
jgi:hypothetical protein